MTTHYITAEICECEEMPRITWRRRDGQWEDRGDIRSNDPVADGLAYNAGDYDAFLVRCPTCGLIYTEGTR